ncbi:MAG: hypothetical protein RIE52_12580 [Balneola sp.]|jgi:hypothetical protein
MKTEISLLSIIALLVLSQSLCAQGGTDQTVTQNPLTTQERGRNIITQKQYENITYNGHTIAQLNSIANDEELLYDIFGSPSSKSVSSFGSINYKFTGLDLGYYAQVENPYISGITATSRSALTVKVLGKSIRVGDSFEDLKQQFGDDLKILYTPELDPDYSISFNSEFNEWDGLLIDLDISTNKINEITYFINP